MSSTQLSRFSTTLLLVPVFLAFTVSGALAQQLDSGGQANARERRLPVPGALGLGATAGVIEFEYAPDGRHVVYLADQDSTGVHELYSIAPTVQGQPVKLNGSLVSGGRVHSSFFSISPDGTRVTYLADQDTDEVTELYSVLIDGSAAPVKLNGALGPTADVNAAYIDASSQRVVFRGDLVVDGQQQLFSAPLDGSAPAVPLSAPLVAGGTVQTFAISPDGARVVYRADQDVDDQFEVYSAPIDGSAAPVQLNGALPLAGDASFGPFRHDAGAVLYRASQEASDREDVYVAPIDGSAPATRVSASPAGTAIVDLRFTPDGTRVVWVDQPGYGLFVAPADASQPPLQLSGAEDVLGRYDRLQFSPDGLSILYPGYQEPIFHLFAVPLDGSTPRLQLSAGGADLVVEAGESPFRISPTGRAVYTARVPPWSSLFSVPIDGSAPAQRLDEPGANSGAFVLTPDGQSVLYEQGGVLRAGPVDGSRPAVLIARDPQRGVEEFAIAPAGDRVVYRVGRELALGLLDRGTFPPTLRR